MQISSCRDSLSRDSKAIVRGGSVAELPIGDQCAAHRAEGSPCRSTGQRFAKQRFTLHRRVESQRFASIRLQRFTSKDSLCRGRFATQRFAGIRSQRFTS